MSKLSKNIRHRLRSQRRRRNRKSQKHDHSRPLFIEPLEHRILLDAGGFNIDGNVLGTGGAEVDAVFFADPSGSIKELGAINSNTTKVGNIHLDTPPTLEYTAVNPGQDLSGVWLDTNVDQNGDVWLYFAFLRAESSTGQVGFEFQQAAAPDVNGAPLDYSQLEILEQPDPPGANAYTQTVMDTYNPWANRQSGDFSIVFDTQGQNPSLCFANSTVQCSMRQRWIPPFRQRCFRATN